ncbi:MAG: uracil-DNA glycosylase family protein [Candidatus Hadarchaeales archaeon]
MAHRRLRAGIPTKGIERRIKTCTLCGLHECRQNAVPGEGPVPSKIVFCGEAPGASEDRLGRPFVGAAGRFLDKLFKMAKIKREEVFITNVVKCRPPGNRTPTDEEVATCTSNYLVHQIKKLKPLLVIASGRTSAKVFLGRAVKMGAEHGRIFECSYGGSKFKLFVTYHPAAALYGGKVRELLEKDFEKLRLLVKNLS